eukprot:gene9658-biopygen1695
MRRLARERLSKYDTQLCVSRESLRQILLRRWRAEVSCTIAVGIASTYLDTIEDHNCRNCRTNKVADHAPHSSNQSFYQHHTRRRPGHMTAPRQTCVGLHHRPPGPALRCAGSSPRGMRTKSGHGYNALPDSNPPDTGVAPPGQESTRTRAHAHPEIPTQKGTRGKPPSQTIGVSAPQTARDTGNPHPKNQDPQKNGTPIKTEAQSDVRANVAAAKVTRIRHNIRSWGEKSTSSSTLPRYVCTDSSPGDVGGVCREWN